MLYKSAKVAIYLIAVVVLLAPTIVWSANPIKIGFLYCMSGRLAHYGLAAKRGGEMAIEEINAQGGINGRKVVGIYADTQLKPDVGVQAARKLVNDDKVDVLMGIVSSGVAKAVAPLMTDLKRPLIITLAMTPDVTGGNCNPYTYRISLNGPQNIRAGALLAADLKKKKWTTIGPDYIFGYQCWEYFQKYLGDSQPSVKFAPNSEVQFQPVATVDWTPFIEKLKGSDADGVLVSLYGGNLIDFIRAGNTENLFDGKREFLMNLALSSDVMKGLGVNMPTGVWCSGHYFYAASSNPLNQEFVKTYVQEYRLPPDQNAHGAYAGVKTYAAAVEAAQSNEPEKVCRALEGLTIDLPVGTVTIRPEDHQAS